MNSKILIIALSITILLIYSCEDSVSPPPSESKIDTVSVIDTFYVIDTLGGDLTQNYFPLTVGNSWSYSISLGDSQGEHRISGIINWKVIGRTDSTIENKVFKMEEDFTGVRIRYSYTGPSITWDTTYEHSISKFRVIQNEYKTVTIIPASYHRIIDSTWEYIPRGITWLPMIIFQQFFPEETSEVVILRGSPWYQGYLGLYADDEEDHSLKLKQNVGILEWKIESTHTGGYNGILNLISYQVKPE